MPAAVEAVLGTFFDSAVAVAAEISPVVGVAAETVRDFVLQGGKRIRPVFAYAGWRCGQPDHTDPTTGADVALRVGAALELVQACALIHDDIIDRSDTRRGRPTVHRTFEARHADASWAGDAGHFGVSAAILAGDLALSWADDLIHGHTPSGPDDDPRPGAALPAGVGDTWAAMRTEVLAGQYLDIVNEASGDESADAAYRVMRYKTAAYTVARPLELGARLAGADPSVIDELRAVGHDLGIAFQLRDDLLGVFGDPARTGKPSGDDLIDGKRTTLLAIGLDRARQHDPALACALRASIGHPLSEDELASARNILVEVGAVAEIEGQISTLLDSALATLSSSAIDPAIRTELTAVAHRTAHREA